IKHTISDKKNTIMFSGYCEPNSLGGRIKSGVGELRIFGKPYVVKADIESIDTLSAHGDYEDISQWLSCQDKQQVQKIFLVHGEYDTQIKFQARLIRKGFSDVMIPDQHEVIGLGV
ncbi:MAG TPA: MBL fold metallo-hydrolase RNA specificity domain-containing protein, partial [Flavipsychrobacter sp.]|nr:MBL fold metallo-hydrolase RNA specificity domain-containing protein [Flavipsychrobacter sp.]